MPTRRTTRQSDARWRRDIRLIAASRGISMAGAEAGYIAVLALAWQLTGSAADASIVLLASVAARTFGAPLAGWIGDHLDRRRVIIAGELGAAASFGALAAAGEVWHILVAMFLGTFFASMAGAALDAAVPNLVPARRLERANSTLGMARTAGHMLGPVLGGLVVAAAGARAAFLLDAASSVVAAALILGVRGDVGGARAVLAAGAEHVRRPFLVGLELLATDPVLRLVAAGWACMCVAFAFVTAAELPLAVEFGVGSAGLGAIITSWCGGSLVGAWAARRVSVERIGARVLAINAGVCAVVFAATGAMPAFAGVLVLMAVGGASMAIADVVEATIVQQRTDDATRARVMAAYQGLMSAVWGTNLALAGVFIDATSARVTYALAGAWCAIGIVGFVAVAITLRRELLARTLRVLRPRHALESELAEGA